MDKLRCMLPYVVYSHIQLNLYMGNCNYCYIFLCMITTLATSQNSRKNIQTPSKTTHLCTMGQPSFGMKWILVLNLKAVLTQTLEKWQVRQRHLELLLNNKQFQQIKVQFFFTNVFLLKKRQFEIKPKLKLRF